MQRFILCAIFLLLLPMFVSSEAPEPKEIPVYIFTQQGCPHCASVLALLDELKKDHPGIKIFEFDLKTQPQYFSAYLQMANAYGIDANGVPITYIGGRAIIGGQESTIREAVEYCSLPVNECVNPGKYLGDAPLPNVSDSNVQAKTKFIGWLVIGIIIISAGAFIVTKLRR